MSDIRQVPDGVVITIDPELRFGEYINGIRVLADGPDEVFIDFAVYSQANAEAQIVFRARCKTSLLNAIKATLTAALEPPTPQGIMLTRDNGQTAVIFPVPNEGGEA